MQQQSVVPSIHHAGNSQPDILARTTVIIQSETLGLSSLRPVTETGLIAGLAAESSARCHARARALH